MQLQIFTFITMDSGIITDVIQTFDISIAIQHEQQWLESHGFMKFEGKILSLDQARALYETVNYDDEYHIYAHEFDAAIVIKSIND